MTKRNQNFSLHAGESRIVFVDLNDAAGADFNPAGCEMQWCAAKSAHSDYDDPNDVVIKKTLGHGLTLVTSGVNIELSASDTLLKPDVYYHELKIFLPGGRDSVAMVGVIRIRPALDMNATPQLGASRATVTGVGTVT